MQGKVLSKLKDPVLLITFAIALTAVLFQVRTKSPNLTTLTVRRPIQEDALSTLKNIPLSLITFVVAATGILFNIGFFSVVGIQFISLFSIQEHIVFSLSGVFIALLVIVMILMFFVLFTHISADRLYTNWFSYVTRILPVALFILFIVLLTIATYNDAGLIATLSLFILSVFSLAMVISIMTFEQNTNKSTAVLLILTLVMACVLFSGALYGGTMVYGKLSRKLFVATTISGERFGIVRIGTDYSLVVSNANIITARRTNELTMSFDRGSISQ